PSARSIDSAPRYRSTPAQLHPRSCEFGTNQATLVTRQWPSFHPVRHRYQSYLFSPICGFVVMRHQTRLSLVEQLFILTYFALFVTLSVTFAIRSHAILEGKRMKRACI